MRLPKEIRSHFFSSYLTLLFIPTLPLPTTTKNMNEKIILITGGNDGIGKATAIGLAKMGATVIIACRNAQKAEEAVLDIQKESDNAKVEALSLDLASFDSIRRCAAQFQERYNQLDVLVNNAGVFTSTLQLTEEGYELQFGVNHLGHFLLTHLLLPQLQAAPSPRVVNVSSVGHYRGKIDFNNLRGENSTYIGWNAYTRSKLANVLFTRAFAQRYPHILCNALHPGGVRTNIATKDSGWLVSFVWKTLGFRMVSTEQGAQTSIYLAASPQVAQVSGKYFDEKQHIQTPATLAQDDELAKKLWEYSETAIQAG